MMYSPDQADIDPRNPANFAEREITRFYICPNQFSDAELDALEDQPDVDTVLDEEVLARIVAKNVSEIVGRPVVISCGDADEYFTEITAS